MLRNAFAYIARKWPIFCLAIILLMGDLSLIGLSMKGRPNAIGKPGIHRPRFSIKDHPFRPNLELLGGAGNLGSERHLKIANVVRGSLPLSRITNAESITPQIKRSLHRRNLTNHPRAWAEH